MIPSERAVGRRNVLRAVGVAGVGLLAGCTGGGSTPTPDPDHPTFDGWLSNVGNYDGVVDETGKDRVTVRVGVEANGGSYGFGPAAVKISSGTTVEWRWTGDGDSHNVVDQDGAFESDMYQEAGVHFEHQFTSTGTYKYYCQPHKALGMKGVIVVE